MKRALQGFACAVLVAFATLGGYSAWMAWEQGFPAFAAAYGGLGGVAFAMAIATVWPDRKGKDGVPPGS